MAISHRTLALVAELRAHLDDLLDARTRALTGAWVRAWDELAAAVAAGIDDLLAAASDGRWPSRATVLRTTRLIGALDAARQRLELLAAQTATGVRADIAEAVPASAAAQRPIVASQLPAGYPLPDAAPATALDAIVARTGEQITAATGPLSRQAYEQMLRALIRGVAIGANPRATAAELLARTAGSFNGGLTRALVISRTETLDAYRAAAAAEHAAQADVLAGWQWRSARDRRTCPSCWSKDGSLHRLDEPGPLDHQQGRCVRLPRTRPWRELGIDRPEPDDVGGTAQQAFDRLPDADQAAVMGPARLAALRTGAATWDQLATRRRTHGWRDSYAPTPVRALRRPA